MKVYLSTLKPSKRKRHSREFIFKGEKQEVVICICLIKQVNLRQKSLVKWVIVKGLLLKRFRISTKIHFH